MVEKYLPALVAQYPTGNLVEVYVVLNQDKVIKFFEKIYLNYCKVISCSIHSISEDEVQILAFIGGDGEKLNNLTKILKEEYPELSYVKSNVKGFMIDVYASKLFILPDVRVVVLLGKEIKDIIRGFYKKFGESASIFLYYLGFSGGSYLAKMISEKTSLNGRKGLIEILKLIQALGLGKIELVKYDIFPKIDIKIRVYDSIECSAFEKSSKPVSQFVRGYLAGLLAEQTGKEVEVIEEKCIAVGDKYCEFHITEK